MKRIGLIGGMSWESTKLYYDLINRLVRDRLGGLHSADLMLASIDFAPLAELQAAGDWEAADRMMVDAARRLQAGGADMVAIGANTMHKCAGAVTAAVAIPLVHLIDALADRLLREGHRRPLILGTRFTMEGGFFNDHLERRGLEPLIPTASDRTELHRMIYDELARGLFTPQSRERLTAMIAAGSPAGADCAVLACTELGILTDPPSAPITCYDTLEIHAEALVDQALGHQTAGLR